jgi:hypothetical protein
MRVWFSAMWFVCAQKHVARRDLTAMISPAVRSNHVGSQRTYNGRNSAAVESYFHTRFEVAGARQRCRASPRNAVRVETVGGCRKYARHTAKRPKTCEPDAIRSALLRPRAPVGDPVARERLVLLRRIVIQSDRPPPGRPGYWFRKPVHRSVVGAEHYACSPGGNDLLSNALSFCVGVKAEVPTLLCGPAWVEVENKVDLAKEPESLIDVEVGMWQEDTTRPRKV